MKFALPLILFSQTLLALPSGMKAVHGEVVSSVDASELVIETGERAILEWDKFSVAGHESVQFDQASAHSAVLNRVTGEDLSQIMGEVSSNGAVYLVNPNGVVIGPEGNITAKSFIASTLELANQSFLADGDLHFSGESKEMVVNLGSINADDAYLLSYRVINEGQIDAEEYVGLGAAREMIVKRVGGERIFIKPRAVDRDGEGISNIGEIESYKIELQADGNLYALAINQSGRVDTHIEEIGGRILIRAEGGAFSQKGDLDSTAIDITADQIDFRRGSMADNAKARFKSMKSDVTIHDEVDFRCQSIDVDAKGNFALGDDVDINALDSITAIVEGNLIVGKNSYVTAENEISFNAGDSIVVGINSNFEASKGSLKLEASSGDINFAGANEPFSEKKMEIIAEGACIAGHNVHFESADAISFKTGGDITLDLDVLIEAPKIEVETDSFLVMEGGEMIGATSITAKGDILLNGFTIDGDNRGAIKLTSGRDIELSNQSTTNGMDFETEISAGRNFFVTNDSEVMTVGGNITVAVDQNEPEESGFFKLDETSQIVVVVEEPKEEVKEEKKEEVKVEAPEVKIYTSLIGNNEIEGKILNEPFEETTFEFETVYPEGEYVEPVTIYYKPLPEGVTIDMLKFKAPLQRVLDRASLITKFTISEISSSVDNNRLIYDEEREKLDKADEEKEKSDKEDLDKDDEEDQLHKGLKKGLSPF